MRNHNVTRNAYLKVILTEVIDANSFFVQIESEELSQLEGVMQQLQSYASTKEAVPEYSPKVGDLVASKFSADDQWYRARVLAKHDTKPNHYHVLYIDYGNEEVQNASALRPLVDSRLTSLSPQAKQSFLAFVQAPALNDDFGKDAAVFFRDLVWGKKMLANVEYRDNEGRMYMSIGDAQSRVHVNAALVNAGLARVNKRYVKYQRATHLVEKLLEEEQQAHKLHLNIWQYGDIPDDDEDDDSAGRRRRGRN